MKRMNIQWLFLIFGAAVASMGGSLIKSPLQQMLSSRDLIMLFPFLMCLIFVAVGILLIYYALATSFRAFRLKCIGDCYDADVTDVYANISKSPSRTVRAPLSDNRTAPFIVECVYSNRSGKRILVKSRNCWPNAFMRQYGSKECLSAKVWVNPKNLRDYYVDITILV